jgi:hypothetical protein
MPQLAVTVDGLSQAGKTRSKALFKSRKPPRSFKPTAVSRLQLKWSSTRATRNHGPLLFEDILERRHPEILEG